MSVKEEIQIITSLEQKNKFEYDNDMGLFNQNFEPNFEHFNHKKIEDNHDEEDGNNEPKLNNKKYFNINEVEIADEKFIRQFGVNEYVKKVYNKQLINDELEDLDNKDKEKNIENSADIFRPFKQEAIENTQNFSKSNSKLQNQEQKLTNLSKNNKEKVGLNIEKKQQKNNKFDFKLNNVLESQRLENLQKKQQEQYNLDIEKGKKQLLQTKKQVSSEMNGQTQVYEEQQQSLLNDILTSQQLNGVEKQKQQQQIQQLILEKQQKGIQNNLTLNNQKYISLIKSPNQQFTQKQLKNENFQQQNHVLTQNKSKIQFQDQQISVQNQQEQSKKNLLTKSQQQFGVKKSAFHLIQKHNNGIQDTQLNVQQNPIQNQINQQNQQNFQFSDIKNSNSYQNHRDNQNNFINTIELQQQNNQNQNNFLQEYQKFNIAKLEYLDSFKLSQSLQQNNFNQQSQYKQFINSDENQQKQQINDFNYQFNIINTQQITNRQYKQEDGKFEPIDEEEITKKNQFDDKTEDEEDEIDEDNSEDEDFTLQKRSLHKPQKNQKKNKGQQKNQLKDQNNMKLQKQKQIPQNTSASSSLQQQQQQKQQQQQQQQTYQQYQQQVQKKKLLSESNLNYHHNNNYSQTVSSENQQSLSVLGVQKKGIKKREVTLNYKNQRSSEETKNLPTTIGKILLKCLKQALPENQDLQKFKAISNKDHFQQLFQLNKEVQQYSIQFLTQGPMMAYLANSTRLKQKRLVVKYLDIIVEGAIDPLNFKCFKQINQQNIMENQQKRSQNQSFSENYSSLSVTNNNSNHQ